MEVFPDGEHQDHYRDDQDKFHLVADIFQQEEQQQADHEGKQGDQDQLGSQHKENLPVDGAVGDHIVEQNDPEDIGKGALIGYKLPRFFRHLNHRRDGDGRADDAERDGVDQGGVQGLVGERHEHGGDARGRGDQDGEAGEECIPDHPVLLLLVIELQRPLENDHDQSESPDDRYDCGKIKVDQGEAVAELADHHPQCDQEEHGRYPRPPGEQIDQVGDNDDSADQD